MRLVGEDPAQLGKVAGEIPRPGPWLQRIRRVRSRPLGDPLGQTVLALSSALLAGGWGVAQLASGRWEIGAALLCLTAIAAALYLALALQALKRDRAVRYWMDCRDLRLDLKRRDAHLRLRWDMLMLLRGMDGPGAEASGPQAALASLVEGTYAVLNATTADDVAVIVAMDANRRYRILHAATSRRSRWAALGPGKHCPADGPVEETLARLARHHRALGIETRHGRLRMVVLSDEPLDEADHALCDELPIYLMLIAERWSPASASPSSDLAVVR